MRNHALNCGSWRVSGTLNEPHCAGNAVYEFYILWNEQLRDLLNRSFFEEFVGDLREALRIYYKDLPDLVVRELNKQTVEKSLKNLHYMMNNHYSMEEINEVFYTFTLYLRYCLYVLSLSELTTSRHVAPCGAMVALLASY